MVPSNGLILSPQSEQYVEQTLAKGCWSPTEFYAGKCHDAANTQGWKVVKIKPDGSEFDVYFDGQLQGRVNWDLIGDFNIENGVMAIAAARHAGVPSAVAIDALAEFINTKRRLELRGEVNQIRVFDDFAHHPTAITKTLAGVRANVGEGRILAVLEPRSNTMKSGVHKATLPESLKQADMSFIFQSPDVQWSVEELIASCHQPCIVDLSLEQLIAKIVEQAQPSDTILVMSNGGFGGIHEKLLAALAEKFNQ